MHPARITLADRRRYADRTTIRWRAMAAIATIGLLATLAVALLGDPLSRADEMSVLVLTVLAVGLSPLLEWIVRFLFARVNLLSERLESAHRELHERSEEAARLRGALRIEDFNSEADELGTIAASFWLKLEWAFDRWVIAHNPDDAPIHEIVEAAAWPDRADLSEDGPPTPERILRGFAASVFPLYGYELISRENFPAFEVVRKNLRRRLRQWGEALQGEQRDDVAAWLRTRVRGAHASTLKLAWYLEIQNAERTGESADADIACYRALRDVFESGGPVREVTETAAGFMDPRIRATRPTPGMMPPMPGSTPTWTWRDQPGHPAD